MSNCDCMDCIHLGLGLEVLDIKKYLDRFPMYDHNNRRVAAKDVHGILCSYIKETEPMFNHDKTGLDAFI